MPDDKKQTGVEKVIFEKIIDENEIARLAHPNILLENDTVTLKSVPPWIHFFLMAVFYTIALITAFHVGLAELSLKGCLIFAAATLVFLVCLVQQKVTTIFDKQEQTVYRRNPFRAMACVPFEKIAEITLVNDPDTAYFKIVLKGDRLGKGIRISRNYDGRNEEFLYIIMKALPAISEMLAKNQSVAPETTSISMLAECPVLYSRNGDIYTFSTWRDQCLFIFFSAFMLFSFAYSNDWMRWLWLAMGSFGLCGAFIVDNRIVINAKEKTIHFSSIFGILKTSFPLNRYSGLHVVREPTNGIYTHTIACMIFRDPEVLSCLYWAIWTWTKTLSALAEETEAIIATALSETDQSADSSTISE